ncbi:MAG TPA: hypothetical protein VK272_06785 [Solirubrobacteraceae bacterium]|nr:hypothetical protein [Solirubrobacteraceae bacterium]
MRLAAALALLALTLAGCESSQEKSAKIEKVVKREAKQDAARKALAQRSLTITHGSTKIEVTSTTVLHSSEGTAALVTLRNLSATAQRDVPIQITVKSTSGAPLYINNTPGLAPALVSMPLLPAHATLTWIDDQVQASGTPASVSAKVGEGQATSGALPKLSVQGAQLIEGGAAGPEVEGSIVNRSSVGARAVVVYAVARRTGAIVAAGSAVVPQVEAGASEHFQAFLIGSAKGARLEVSAAPSSLG